MRANTPPASPPMSCNTAANKGVLLAFVAMAQTLVVITSGIDLSVGMIFVLTNCLASAIVVGSPLTAALGVDRRARRRARLRRHQRPHRHLRPAAADRHHDCHRRRLFRHRAVAAAAARRQRRVQLGSRRRLDRPAVLAACRQAWSRCSAWCWWSGSPTAALPSAAPPMPSARRRSAAYMSGVPIRRAKFAAYTLAGLLAGDRRLVPDLHHLFGRGLAASGGNLHAVLDRRRRARRRVAVRRRRQRGRRDLRRADLSHHRRSAVRVRSRPACGSRCSRAWCCSLAVCLGSVRLFQVRNRLDLFG